MEYKAAQEVFLDHSIFCPYSYTHPSLALHWHSRLDFLGTTLARERNMVYGHAARHWGHRRNGHSSTQERDDLCRHLWHQLGKQLCDSRRDSGTLRADGDAAHYQNDTAPTGWSAGDLEHFCLYRRSSECIGPEL